VKAVKASEGEILRRLHRLTYCFAKEIYEVKAVKAILKLNVRRKKNPPELRSFRASLDKFFSIATRGGISPSPPSPSRKI
jgi:hypothetical protein